MSVPDHIRYGGPEECIDALSRPLRCESDLRWIELDTPEPLPAPLVEDIDYALSQRTGIARRRCTICGVRTPLVCAGCGKARCHDHSITVAMIRRCSGGCSADKEETQ